MCKKPLRLLFALLPLLCKKPLRLLFAILPLYGKGQDFGVRGFCFHVWVSFKSQKMSDANLTV